MLRHQDSLDNLLPCAIDTAIFQAECFIAEGMYILFIMGN